MGKFEFLREPVGNANVAEIVDDVAKNVDGFEIHNVLFLFSNRPKI
jgi:hypothetical protein